VAACENTGEISARRKSCERKVISWRENEIVKLANERLGGSMAMYTLKRNTAENNK